MNRKKCNISPNGEHDFIYPRTEDSIDKIRELPPPYCKYCFKVRIRLLELPDFNKSRKKTKGLETI